jgi:type IV pilus assembly protein PilA
MSNIEVRRSPDQAPMSERGHPIVLNNLKARRANEEGFTLIELMVVVLIIAILIAIAIPTFLGARTRAQNRAAQSSLRNALTAAKTAYTDNSDYSLSTDVQLPGIEPSLQYVGPAVASADLAVVGPPAVNYPSFKVVSVAVTSVSGTDNQIWSAAVLSKSGTCYYIKDVATGTGAGTFFGSSPTAATCTGTAAATGATAGAFP